MKKPIQFNTEEKIMGNRAVITTSKKKLGVYLHWNGGRDSVEAFLKYCELQHFRSPDNDCYGWARLCQVIGNYFGGSLSVGIDDYWKLDTDNQDNGVYIIRGWEIIGRDFFEGAEQNEYPLNEMLKEIDKHQPKEMQLGGLLDAEEVDPMELKIGDTVYMYTYDSYEQFKVVGFGEDKIVNGTNVNGLPYVDRYMNDGSYEHNPNNYITTPTVWRK